MSDKRNLRGRRVRLIEMSDPYAVLHRGAMGTISIVDDTGTLHVDWDDGSTLGLIPGEDSYQILPEGAKE